MPRNKAGPNITEKQTKNWEDLIDPVVVRVARENFAEAIEAVREEVEEHRG